MTRRHSGLLPILLLLTAPALAADPPLTQGQAMALLHAGHRQEALHAFEAMIAAHPADPADALYAAGLIDLQDGNWQAARPYIEPLIRLRPSSFAALELLIQLDQAAGDIPARDAAIRSLQASWRGATDPKIRSKVSFLRDRIPGSRHTMLARETLDLTGDDVLYYAFQPADEEGKVRHMIVVRSDSETNQQWRAQGRVPSGTVVYHIDTIEQRADGQSVQRPYEYDAEPPSYDRIRAKIEAILAGTAQPLSGTADPFLAGESAKAP